MHPARNGQAAHNRQASGTVPSTRTSGGLWRRARQAGRLARLFAATVTRTLYLSVSARRQPADKRLIYRARRQETGCRLLCKIAGIRVTVHGSLPESDTPAGRGRLLVCNHIGALDPIVLASRMPVSFAGKAEIAQWPFVGWVTREMGVFSVERDRRTSTGEFVERVQERLQRGVDVLVFPEGQTTRGASVLTFKTGAFAAVAGDEQGTVIPLCLLPRSVEGRPAIGTDLESVTWADTPQTFAEHVWHLLGLRYVHYDIHIGEPITTAGRDRKELAQVAHHAVEALHQSYNPDVQAAS
ncbi:MAG: lysophospholipid acyltransferase family protein [Rhodothermales bacterium]